MSIVRYDPWRWMEGMQGELNRLFDARREMTEGDDSDVVTSRWAPAVDIREEEEQFTIHADIPGVDPKEIEVQMENGMLSIKGERKTESDQKESGYTRIERSSGLFYRRFNLPDTADIERVSARGNHGVLIISIPKKETVKPRKIAINVA